MSDAFAGNCLKTSDNFQFGPQMKFEQFDEKMSSQSPTLASAYLNGKLSKSFLKSSDLQVNEFMSTQSEVLREFSTILDKQTELTVKWLIEMKLKFLDEQSEAEREWSEMKEKLEILEKKRDEINEGMDKELEKLMDTVSQITANFNRKSRIENFIRKNENFPMKSQKIVETMKENTRRVENIQKLLAEHNQVKLSEEQRVDEVYHRLVGMIHQLPLEPEELAELKQFFDKTGNRIDQCELITRRLFAIMSGWSSDTSRIVSEDYWQSVSDSNLTDLDGLLWEAQVRTAIERGEAIQLETWSSASDTPNFSSSEELSLLEETLHTARDAVEVVDLKTAKSCGASDVMSAVSGGSSESISQQ